MLRYLIALGSRQLLCRKIQLRRQTQHTDFMKHARRAEFDKLRKTHVQLQPDRNREYRRTHRMRNDKVFFGGAVGRCDSQHITAVFSDKNAQAPHRFRQTLVIDLFMRRIVRIYVIDIIHVFVVYILHRCKPCLLAVFERTHAAGIFERTLYTAAEKGLRRRGFRPFRFGLYALGHQIIDDQITFARHFIEFPIAESGDNRFRDRTSGRLDDKQHIEE